MSDLNRPRQPTDSCLHRILMPHTKIPFVLVLSTNQALNCHYPYTCERKQALTSSQERLAASMQ